jgi:hypothetical protein
VKLNALVVEIRRRSRTLPAPEVDPIEEIMRRVPADPDTPESRSLVKIAGAIGMEAGELDEREIWNLSQEALELLDALVERRISQPQ